MIVKVRFFATLREITGCGEATITLNGKAFVGELLQRLSEDYGSEFDAYVFEKGSRKLRSHLQILVDGINVPESQELSFALRDGSVVAIIPPVGGG